MTVEEIFKYLNVGKTKSIIVDRRSLEDYPGIFRNITIRENSELQIDFLDKNILEADEGEMTIYFYYESFEKLISAVENYIGQDMSQWVNYSKLDTYPQHQEADLALSWLKFKKDFAAKKLSIPCEFSRYVVRGFYWKALDSGEVNVDDSEEVFHQWMKRKMEEI